jgi:hypothetical protein
MPPYRFNLTHREIVKENEIEHPLAQITQNLVVSRIDVR